MSSLCFLNIFWVCLHTGIRTLATLLRMLELSHYILILRTITVFFLVWLKKKEDCFFSAWHSFFSLRHKRRCWVNSAINNFFTDISSQNSFLAADFRNSHLFKCSAPQTTQLWFFYPHATNSSQTHVSRVAPAQETPYQLSYSARGWTLTWIISTFLISSFLAFPPPLFLCPLLDYNW